MIASATVRELSGRVFPEPRISAFLDRLESPDELPQLPVVIAQAKRSRALDPVSRMRPYGGRTSASLIWIKVSDVKQRQRFCWSPKGSGGEKRWEALLAAQSRRPPRNAYR